MSTSRDDFGIVIRSALLQRGAKQKFSLFVLILLSLFIFILDNSNLKPIKILRSLINDGIYRISAVSSSPIKFSGASKDFFVKHIFTYEENERLRKELEDLKSKNFQSSFLEAQNNKLQNVLDLEKNSPYSVVNAKVILDKNSPFLNSVIINKGSNAGIKLGMPVLNEGYLAGRIVEVNFVSARILLLNDLNSRIPVVVSPSGTQAILSGVGKREPSLEYLPDNFMLGEKESIVFTSGKDGVLFPGIAIGKVVLNDNKKLVKLFADPDQISVVSVALDQQEDSGAR